MIWKLKVQTIWIIVFILFFFLLQISIIIFSNFKLYKKNSHYNQGCVLLYKSLLQFKNENFLLQNELGGISYDFDQKIMFWKLVNSFKMMK
jgi:hypothetical protein